MSEQQPVARMTDEELGGIQTRGNEENGFGSMRTERGLLPLEALEARAKLDGLLSRVSVTQTFVNCMEEPLEATYIFPLPDRAAVTRFEMEVAGRKVEGKLRERGEAREAYDRAIEAGHRASIAEEERSGVFTIRVGNLMPGERATVRLELAGPMAYSEGEVTFRFPLVVAPRYIPGIPLGGPSVGDGVSPDTDATPDASRITPPVLLPGFPNPVRLTIEVEVNETMAVVGPLRSSLHAVVEERGPGVRAVRVRPGERLDRDFVLRYRLGGESVRTSLSVHPDADGKGEGTFALTVIPPELEEIQKPKSRGRDVVFVLDRSGSMSGWKMVAARRAVGRMVETLGPDDRFLILAFDDKCEGPSGLPAEALVVATDHHRFLASEYLGGLESRGGTEMAPPLRTAARLLARQETSRDRWLVLVTDGQVGNEDQLLRVLAGEAAGLRVLTLGIDQAVNEGFLRRLAALGEGGGVCELAETSERLEEALETIHRRLGSPSLRGLRVATEGKEFQVLEETLVPARPPDLHAGSPVLLLGRYRGRPGVKVRLEASTPEGREWAETVSPSVRENPAITWAWARGQVRQLEDDYAVGAKDQRKLERRIVETSLRFGVLSRFTAYVAVDGAEVVNPGGITQRVTQAVEAPAGQVHLASSYMKFDEDLCMEETGLAFSGNWDQMSESEADQEPRRRKRPSLNFRELLPLLPSLRRAREAATPPGVEQQKDKKEAGARFHGELPPALPAAPLRRAAYKRLEECRSIANQDEKDLREWFDDVRFYLQECLHKLWRQKKGRPRLERLQEFVELLMGQFGRGPQVSSVELTELRAEAELLLAALAGDNNADRATPEPRKGFWK